MQFKIPQEINVEDKVVGPFTLKSFGFIIAFVVTGVIFMSIFKGFGLSLVGSFIIGAFLASPILLLGFVPFNGKPLYVYAGAFFAFLFKPKVRVWKKEMEPLKSSPTEDDKKVQAKQENTAAPIKESIETADKKIEEISLLVDTGGAYGETRAAPASEEPADTFSEDQGRQSQIERSLQNARKALEKNSPASEPPISDFATVDPKEKFNYKKFDTSKYEIDKVVPPQEKR